MQSQKQFLTRLHILQGQLRGLEALVEKDTYCPDIIRLSLAIQKSLQSFNQSLLEKHLLTHASEQFRKKQDKKAITELLDIYFLSNR
jgi:DNA-binding FrmR family transcriptional regulator